MATPRSRLRTEVLTVDGADRRTRPDDLAVEEPLEVRIAATDPTRPEGRSEARRVAITMRTPGADLDLAVGFLASEGLLTADDLVDVSYCGDAELTEAQRGNTVTVTVRGPLPDLGRLERHGVVSSACGVCGRTHLDEVVPHAGLAADATEVDVDVLRRLPERLRDAQAVFDRTGGLHAAARFDADGTLLDVREDVGRHNALDALVGASVRRGTLPWTGQVLLLSGRASFELLSKAAVAGVPVVAAVGAPSSLAVEVAEHAGITLVGFLRADRCNVYTHAERLVVRLDTP
ncbi:MAG: formate dehydrogenase accessory sulfurtransferase FdhD [Actinomycetes bacterium]